MERFHTLQGEGIHQGKAAYFVRLGGCDVGCVWCDVKESWDFDKHPKVAVGEIVETAWADIAHTGADPEGAIVVVTGGEPLLHELGPLTHALRSAGFRAHLETSGSSPLSGQWDWICLSPKKFKPPLDACLAAANEFKPVVYHKSDLAWAAGFLDKLSPGCHLLLQPEWGNREMAMPIIVEYVKAHPQWRMCLQSHKYIGVP